MNLLKDKSSAFLNVLLISALLIISVATLVLNQESEKKDVNLTTSITVPNLSIIIDKKDYRKIKSIRDKAMAKGLLLSSDNQWVEGKILFNKKTYNIKIRLKGDLTDHLEGETWSFKIKTKKNYSLFGYNTFSIQKPATRKHLSAFLVQNFQKRESLPSVGMKLLKINLNGKDLGVYLLEQDFDNILLQDNNLTDGPIMSFTENLNWEESELYDKIPYITPIQLFHLRRDFRVLNISDNKTSEYAQELRVAESILLKLAQQKIYLNEAFQIEELAKFLAICDVFGAHHALHPGNSRFYFNKLTQKFIPIGFDHDAFDATPTLIAESAHGIQDNLGGYLPKYIRIWEDQKLTEKYLFYLYKFTSDEYIQSFLKESDAKLSLIYSAIKEEDPSYEYPINKLKHNINLIRYKFTTINNLRASLTNKRELKLANINYLPLVIDGIYDRISGKLLEKIDLYLLPNYKFKDFQFKTIKLKKSYKPQNITIKFKIPGGSQLKEVLPTQWKASSPHNNLILPLNKLAKNLEDKAFLNIDKKNKLITFKSGVWTLEENIFIPVDYSVEIESGFSLQFVNNSCLISRSPILSRGTHDQNVNFIGQENGKNGIIVSNTKDKSFFKFTNFRNLNGCILNKIKPSGSVIFENANVDFLNSTFKSNTNEDFLNIIRGETHIISSSFENIFSDAFDCDFCTGSITNSTFKNVKNDSLDFSKAKFIVENVRINKSGNKGISIGEASDLQVKNTSIQDAPFAIAIKDLSRASVTFSKFRNSDFGISVYQKKTHYGPGSATTNNNIFENVKSNYLIETGSELTEGDVALRQVQNKSTQEVLEQLKKD